MVFSLQEVITLIDQYKYAILFPLIAVEGPITMVIAGFLASAGFLNVFLVYLIAVSGDLAGDCLYYAVGRYGGRELIKRWGRFLRIKPEKIEEVEQHFDRRGGKTLVWGKLTQAVGSIILIAAGISKMPVKDFIWYNFIATLPKALVLVLLGFYFGQAYTSINSFFKLFGVISLGLTIILIVYFFYYHKKDSSKK